MLNLDNTYAIKLIIRGPTRITSIEILLVMSKKDLINFEYFLSEGETPLSINSAEIALLRSLKRYIWYLNMTSQSTRNNFMKIDLIDFNNFGISNK